MPSHTMSERKKKGSSHKKETAKQKTNKRVSKQISKERKAGFPEKQAVAIGINIIKERKKKEASAKARKTRAKKK